MGIGNIWFWQRIVSPHMAGLAASLSYHKDCQVRYVAEKMMSTDREEQGWVSPSLGRADLAIVKDEIAVKELIDSAPVGTVHICLGIRANGLVGLAQRELAKKGCVQWIIMETVEDSGWRGVLKRLEYRRLFFKHRKNLTGVLGIGYKTPNWVIERGVPAYKVFPFSYFLPDENISTEYNRHLDSRFRILFVGQFIQLKRLDLLINALAIISVRDIELFVVGSGPLEDKLRSEAEQKLSTKVKWIGKLPINEVRQVMKRVDCLVLPSSHDGWGAVVSEALMVGTPVICSDRCGSAGIVEVSGVGGVFKSGNIQSLSTLLNKVIKDGKLDPKQRLHISSWAQSLNADAGAEYLLSILNSQMKDNVHLTPPWLN